MKFISIFIIIFLGLNNVASQNFVVSTKEVVQVYKNIENPLKTNISSIDSTLLLITENGEIYKKEDGFTWKPVTRGIAFLKLGKIEDSDTTIIDSLKFKVVSLALPELTLNVITPHSGFPSWQYSDKLVFDFGQMKQLDFLNLGQKIKIKSFEMEVSIKDKIDKQILYSDSEFLPSEFDKIRKILYPNDILTISFRKIEIDCEWFPDLKYYEYFLDNNYSRSIQWTWRIN